jgi:RNA polymerase sigma factor (sigma-70 family)
MSPVSSRVMSETKKALLERLFAQHGAALLAFFYQRVRRRPDAAELAQEVYLRMLRVSDIEAIRNPEAYLYTVASNLAKEHRVLEQRSANTLDIDDAAELLADLTPASAEIDTERRIKRLREVLRQLSPKGQAAVALHYWHGMNYQEVALQLGVSTHMVKKYLSQALAHCRRRMARLG